ncbi:sialoadhesin-like [Plectropomus leopardus]|uniref:sialoadhesin-like n=1 Tax=Plectropomus leopardus TaxID=160734 RepID=UPI001C4CACE7|nr:sialoadhesin-like [Plectropomus leopardus]
MSLTAAASGFVVFLLSAQVIWGRYFYEVTYPKQNICAPEGSTVDIHCSYKYPGSHETEAITKFWFIKMEKHNPLDLTKDPKYSGRADHSCNNKKCTLTIRDLRQSDSGKYRFRFITNDDEKYTGEPGVTLSVTGLQVTKLTSNSLKCFAYCGRNHFHVMWYRNGHIIPYRTTSLNSFTNGNSYSCALEGHEDFPSPSLCVGGHTCNGLTYTDKNICASKGSSVDISCTYDRYNYTDKSTFWFSGDRSHYWPPQPEDLMKKSQYSGRVEVKTERGRSTLKISDLRESDSARYYLKFKTGSFEWTSSPGTSLTVTALQVQVIRTVIRSATYVELKCLSSCFPARNPSYVWFRSGEKMTWGQTYFYYGPFDAQHIISCALIGHESSPSPPVYAPKRPSVSVSPSEIEEGSSVTLTCSSDANPAANYTWYKEDGNLDLKPLSTKKQFAFTPVQSSHSGEYYCTAKNELGNSMSESISINVKYAPRRPSVSVSPSAEIEEGSSVTLSCSCDANPAAKYTWYKENQTLVQGPEGIHHFDLISFEDSGIYHCKCENKYGNITFTPVRIDVQYAPKRPSVSVSPSAEIEEGSSVTLTCSSDANPAANYTWYKENEDSPKAFRQIFIITEIRAEHSGNYYCEAQNSRGRQNSTLHLIIVSSSMKSVAAGSITVIFLALIFLSAFLLMRRKKSLEQTLEPRVRQDNKLQVNMVTVRDVPSAPRPRSQAEQQDDLCYASVTFLKNREDPLYSNIRLGQPIRPKEVEEEDDEEDEEEDVEYTAVMFKSNGAATGSTHQEAAEDSSELYSTVCKNTRV